MKITQWQRFYLDTTLEAVDQQLNNSMDKLEQIYKDYYQDREKLINELSRTILEYTVKGEYMELNATDKKQIQDKLNNTVNSFVENEKNSDKGFIEDALKDAINGTYGYKDYVLGLGIDFKSLPLDEKEVQKIINNKVAGKNWSSRLWDNKSALQSQLRKDIFNFCKGDISVNKINKQILDRFNADKNNTKRLVRTEICRSQQEIINKFDTDHDLEYQLFMATLDNKTSEICRTNDGKVFKITDTGKPNPPTGTHPNCRSVLVGIPDKDYKPDTRRNNEDKTIIPYEKYNDWNKAQQPVKPPKPTAKPKLPKQNKQPVEIKDMNYNQLEKKAKDLNVTFGSKTGGNLPNTIEDEILRKNISFVDDIQKKYPQLSKYNVKLCGKNLGTMVNGQCSYGGEITLNARKFGNKTQIEAWKNSGLERARGWTSQTSDSLNSTFVHEYGHFISAELSKKEFGGDWDKCVKEIRSETKKEYKKQTGQTVIQRDLHKMLSQYGASDVHETFAEAFQEAYNSKNPSEYAIAFKTVLERWLVKL